MNSIKLELDPPEMRLLTQMRVQDVRTIRDQVRWLILAEAKRRGLLPASGSSGEGWRDATTPNEH